MRNIIFGLLVVLNLFFLLSCSSKTKVEKSNTNQYGGWASDMRGMAQTVEKLMPYVFSRDEFHDPENTKKIKSYITDYSERVSVVKTHAGEQILGDDPIVKYTIGHLKDSTQQALSAFNEGHREYSRNVLKDSIGACFNCHSSNQLGPQSGFSTAQLGSGFRMYATEKADFYVSTRQYDRAIDVLESVLKTPDSYEGQPHEQVAAIKKYLSLVVRVKRDPARAAQSLNMFLSQGRLPYFIASDAESWLSSIRDWQTEKKISTPPLQKAKELLKKADKKQAVGSFQAGYVENLRATTYLHEALKVTQNPQDKAEIYFLLGESYDIISDLGVWDLPELYFESCIRTNPKSKISQKCYKSYEKSIVLGFSGSAGLFLPTAEKNKLAELKKIAGL